MCQFKSAIVIKDKQEKYGFRLLMSPVTESHSDLEQLLNLKDGARLNYAKIEFTPKDFSTAHRVETYKLYIDEARTPDWFNDEIKTKVIEKMSKTDTKLSYNDSPLDLKKEIIYLYMHYDNFNKVKEILIARYPYQKKLTDGRLK